MHPGTALLFLVGLVLGTGSVARCEDPHRLPQHSPPSQAIACLKDGKLSLTIAVTSYKLKRIKREGAPDITVFAPSVVEKNYLYDLDKEKVTVVDADNQKVDVKKLPELLPKETVALCVFTIQGFDPLHLRLVKPGTLCFIVPPRDTVGVVEEGEDEE